MQRRAFFKVNIRVQGRMCYFRFDSKRMAKHKRNQLIEQGHEAHVCRGPDPPRGETF